MKTRRLGAHGPMVAAIDLGGMGMSDFYANRDDAASVATIRRALDPGINFPPHVASGPRYPEGMMKLLNG